jgi:DsbC/DsbD-like thiol-disulfide interchange protein
VTRAGSLASAAGALALGAVVLGPPRALQAPAVEVRAIPEYASVTPGMPFRVALQLAVPAGWHIGWVNPGAGGLGTSVTWVLPRGVGAGETDWPYPETEDAADGVSNVYRDTVVVFSSFRVEPGATGTLDLSADLEWGLCRSQCVRQTRTVTTSLRVGRSTSHRSRAWNDVALALRALPVHVGGDAVRATAVGDSVTLAIARLPAGPDAGSWLTFFPLESGKASVVAEARATGDGIAVNLPRRVAADSARRLAGVLVGPHSAGAAPATRPLAVDVQLTP